MFRSVSLIIYLLYFCCFSSAQGIIVNEFSQGTSGSREFVELLVVGSSGQPNGNVNLSGWILDDNNGEWGGTFTGVGVGNGHVILGNCLNNVPIGSLIVIYNTDDPNPAIPADDPNDSNNDLVYIIPLDDGCLSQCLVTPNRTTMRSDYNCTGGTSQPVNVTFSGPVIYGLAGDAVQVRRPNGDFYHGYSYGNVPGTLSFNISGSGNRTYEFQCGDWDSASNFSTSNASAQTPGEGNSEENSRMIQNIQNGYFDYDNPNRLDHCANVLNPRIAFFEGNLVEDKVDLAWKIQAQSLSEVNLERKTLSGVFQSLESFKPQENKQFYTDALPIMGKNTYRLKLRDIQGGISYSNQLEVWVGDEQFSRLFPNPTKDQLFLDFSSPAYRKVFLISALGQQVMNPKVFTEENGYISLEKMPEGMYWLKILHENGRVELKKVIKSK